MDIDTLSEAAAALHAATVDSLDEVIAAVTRCAQSAGMLVLPATLDFDSTAVLDHEQLNVEQVVTAAASSGTTLLYLHRKVVDEQDTSAAIRELDLPADGEVARRALLKETKRVAGWTSELEVGFAHQGVMNVWAVVAVWADVLTEVTLRPGRQSTRWSPGGAGDEDTLRLDDAAIAQLAGQLAAIPQFRRASRGTEREAAVQQVPELARLLDHRDGRWQVHSVMREATELLQDQVAICLDRLKSRQDDLVAALAGDEKFRAVRTVEARHKFAQEWSLEHTDGLRIPSWWIKELVAATKGLPTQLTF